MNNEESYYTKTTSTILNILDLASKILFLIYIVLLPPRGSFVIVIF